LWISWQLARQPLLVAAWAAAGPATFRLCQTPHYCDYRPLWQEIRRVLRARLSAIKLQKPPAAPSRGPGASGAGARASCSNVNCAWSHPLPRRAGQPPWRWTCFGFESRLAPTRTFIVWPACAISSRSQPDKTSPACLLQITDRAVPSYIAQPRVTKIGCFGKWSG